MLSFISSLGPCSLMWRDTCIWISSSGDYHPWSSSFSRASSLNTWGLVVDMGVSIQWKQCLFVRCWSVYPTLSLITLRSLTGTIFPGRLTSTWATSSLISSYALSMYLSNYAAPHRTWGRRLVGIIMSVLLWFSVRHRNICLLYRLYSQLHLWCWLTKCSFNNNAERS